MPTQQVTSRPSRKMTAWADFLPRMRRTSLLMTQSMPPASETMPIVPAIKTNSRIMLAMPYMPFATVVQPSSRLKSPSATPMMTPSTMPLLSEMTKFTPRQP